MNPYDQLPDPPVEISAVNLLKRLIDGLGFRFQISTKGLTAVEYQFRPVATSMNIEEVQLHIFHLVKLSASALGVEYEGNDEVNTVTETRQSILGICHEISNYLDNLSEEDLSHKKIYLKRTDTEYPFWYLINGYIADALTHVGQVNSWRRMAGNPVSRISPFTGMSY